MFNAALLIINMYFKLFPLSLHNLICIMIIVTIAKIND